MKIAIKADGGEGIGMGHIVRTLVLAKKLEATNDVSYICSKDTEFKRGIELVKKEGLKIVHDLQTEGDILITDSYDVNEQYFYDSKKRFKYTIYIDDLNKFFHPVDLLINQNINASALQYQQKNTLLGVKYALLREEFEKIQPKVVKREVANILITMGGADPHNITAEILDSIKSLPFTFHVAIGPAFKNKEQFSKISKSNILIYENSNMINLMKLCDIAISAGGSTLYELCACGTPTLGVIIAENQIGASKKFDDLNLIKNLGYYDKIESMDLTKEILMLSENFEKRNDISYRMQSLVDGLGAERIANYINNTFI